MLASFWDSVYGVEFRDALGGVVPALQGPLSTDGVTGEHLSRYRYMTWETICAEPIQDPSVGLPDRRVQFEIEKSDELF